MIDLLLSRLGSRLPSLFNLLNSLLERGPATLLGLGPRLAGEHLASQAEVVCSLLEAGSSGPGLAWDEDLVCSLLEAGGRPCLLPCLRLAQAASLASPALLAAARTALLETRGTALFWPGLHSLARLSLAALPASPAALLLDQLAGESEAVAGVLPALLDCVGSQAAALPAPALLALLPLLARALTWVPLYRKDQRVLLDTCAAISAEGKSQPANWAEGSEHLGPALARTAALQVVLTTTSRLTGSELSGWLLALLSALQQVNTRVTAGKTRHFENSEVHRVRVRVYQVYVLVAGLLGAEEGDEVMEEVCTALARHSEQASTRQLQEWAAVLLVLSRPARLDRVWERLESSAPGPAPSWLTVISHSLSLQSVAPAGSLERGLTSVAPWCMAQQFQARLVAQLCFRKLWTACTKSAPQLVERYSVLRDCIERSVKCGGQGKLTTQQQFYLSHFCPLAHSTLADILREFPRLSGLPEDEQLPGCLLSSLPGCHHPPSSPGLAALPSPAPNSPPQTDVSTTGDTVQQKITPWTAQLGDPELGAGRRADPAHPGLVVAASLLEKAPNLGGLARTCEILGAGGLVLPRSVYCVPHLSVPCYTVQSGCDARPSLPSRECDG